MRYKDAGSAAEFLRYVLENWENFKLQNGGLCKAINDILKENEQLKAQAGKMRGGHTK